MSHVRVTPNWILMSETVEGTEWHREANVAVHTEMTMDYYMKTFAPFRSDRQQVLALTALCFHDFGKPSTEVTTEKDGKPRHQYLGHEEVSAKATLDFFFNYPSIAQIFYDAGYFNWDHVLAVVFVIERHLPYGLKKPEKVKFLKDQIKHHLGSDEEVFFDVLRSDAGGRIMDDPVKRMQDVEDWIAEFRKVQPPAPPKLSHEERKAAWMAKQALEQK